ncbi:hypothetical protein [Dickeya sp. CFBP 2040]|uniref:hypothetical protein n=1 Tax=Dickeya sp. CFBP 2040 TaxID=2718531 RepID=UPI001FF083E5|nr:hypothetical protein [Dickeya sp. CFBP 2040]
MMSLWGKQAQTIEAARNSRLITVVNQVVPLAISIGEKFDIPVMTVYFAPLTPSRSIPSLMVRENYYINRK